MGSRNLLLSLPALGRSFLLGSAVVAISVGTASLSATAQPLTKEEEAKLKQKQQQQQPKRQDAPGQGQPSRRAPEGSQNGQRPPGPPPTVRPPIPPSPPPVPRVRPQEGFTAPPGGSLPRQLPNVQGGPQGGAGTGLPAQPPQIKRLDGTVPSTNPGRALGQPTAPGATPPPPPGQGGQFLPKRPQTAPGTAGVPGTPGAPGVPQNGQVVPGKRPGAPSGIPAAGQIPPPGGTGPLGKPGAPVLGRVVAPAAGPIRLDDVKKSRVERVDSGGRKIIEESGNRVIIKQDNRLIIHKNEAANMRALHPNARAIPLPGGLTQTVYTRPDGVRVTTEVDRSGRIVRRFGQAPGGRRFVYVDNRRFYRNLAIGAGVAVVGVGALIALSAPAHALPREKYIVEYDRASDDDIYEALVAPPVERLERSYSLDEIRYNFQLRERMRRIDLDTITFELGSFEIAPDQYPKLERMARAIGRAIERNPAEVFLIEGHTDAVGQPEDNLSLSDRRAESVARILSEYFSIPGENIVTQGYGEQFLKIPSDGAERANRRVAVRRISPMLSQDDAGPR